MPQDQRVREREEATGLRIKELAHIRATHYTYCAKFSAGACARGRVRAYLFSRASGRTSWWYSAAIPPLSMREGSLTRC